MSRSSKFAPAATTTEAGVSRSSKFAPAATGTKAGVSSSRLPPPRRAASLATS
jgi:hypothetical protein